MNEENEIQIRDIFDEQTYYQYQKQEHEKLLDADSKAYEDLKPLIEAQRASKGEAEENEEDAEKKIKDYLKKHNNGKENNEYLVRGAELQCSCGSHTRKLNLSPCHGVYIKGHPVVHELDCMQGAKDNITWFGVCSNEDLVSVDIMIKDENGGEIRGLKCDPEIVGIWIDSYEGTRIVDNGNKMQDDPDNPAGCNTLTVGSFLVCRNGGIISPVSSGQDRKVEIEEFVEGWNAYRRVMGLRSSEEGSLLDKEQSISLLPKAPEPKEHSTIEDKFGETIMNIAPNRVVLNFLASHTREHIPQSTINNNFYHNLRELRNSDGSSASENEFPVYVPGEYIENQKQWVNIYFGESQMSGVGCEIMATHNALKSLGEDMTAEKMAALISGYEEEGAVFQGAWGVAPTAIYSYFSDRGYDVGMTDSLLMEDINAFGEEYDTVIISFFNDQDNVCGQIHTVNVSKEDGKYYSHNANWVDNERYVQSAPYDSLWDIVIDIAGRDAKPVSVIGINRKEEENE